MKKIYVKKLEKEGYILHNTMGNCKVSADLMVFK